MPDFLTLSCPVCTGQLKITEDLNRFACAYCGTEHLVRRTDSTISLQPMVEGLRNVQKGVDRTASELAIVRLEREIPVISQRLMKAKEEREALRANYDLIVTRSFVAIMIAIAALVLLFYSALRGDGNLAVSALFFGGLAVAYFLETRKKQPMRLAQIEQLSQVETKTRRELQTRQKELAHHRKIASLEE